MNQAKKQSSLMKRRVLACVIGLIAVLVLLIAMTVVKSLVKITPWEDADGTKYYIREKNGVYGLYDQNKVEMTKESAYEYYETRLGTLVEVDEETGKLGEVIYVEDIFTAQGNEVEDIRHRVQIFPHIKKADILSIDVYNENGNFSFVRYNTDTGKVDKTADFIIKRTLGTTSKYYTSTPYSEETFAELYVDAGYTLSTMKLENPIKNANGEFSEYGLVAEMRTKKVFDENGQPKEDENGNPVTEQYWYEPAYFVVTDVAGNRHKIIVGDPLLTGKGYYVQYVSLSETEEVKRDAVYVLDSSLKTSVLASVEDFVTPILNYPMGMMTYTNVEKFTVRQLENALSAGQDPVYKPIVSFSYQDIAERENTLSSSFPYYFDDVSFMEEIRSMKGYFPHTDNINSCLQNLYDIEFTDVVKFAPSNADLVNYRLYAVKTDENGTPILDEKGSQQYLPAAKYTLSYDYTVADEEVDGMYFTHSHVILISEKNQDGNYYAYSIITTTGYQKQADGSMKKIKDGYTYTYDSIVEVAGHSLSFLEWDTMKWVSQSFIQSNIAFIDEIKLETSNYQAKFDLDNSASKTDSISSADLKVHATDSKNRDITTFSSLTVVDKWDFTWVITAAAIQVYDSNGKEATIKDGISYYDYNDLGSQVLVRSGYIECKNGDKVEVTANRVKVIHPNGNEDNYVRYSTNLFRLLYQTMFYAQIVNTYEVDAEEEAILTDPSNLMVSLTITTKDRDGTLDTNVYNFYRISSRKAYITINGNGGFYILSGRVEKFLSDAEKFFNVQIIDPTAKT